MLQKTTPHNTDALFGASIASHAIHAVMFQTDSYIEQLLLAVKDKDVDTFKAALREHFLDGYRFSWKYLDQLAQRIDFLNNENPFCAFGRARNVLYIDYFREALSRIWRPGLTTLDLGCGRSAPLSIATIMRLNGAEACYAVDVADDESPAQTQTAILRILTEAVLRTDVYNFSKLPRPDFINNVSRFDPDQISAATLSSDIRKFGIYHQIADFPEYEQFPVFDFVHSVSVIEHIPDLDECFNTLRAKMRPGGIMCHVVDFSDHGPIIRTSPHRYHHLKTGELMGINGDRLSDVIAKIEAAGFSVEIVKEDHDLVPEDVLSNLHERFARYSDRDLSCYGANLVATAR